MTQKEKLMAFMLFAQKVKNIARNIMEEGNDYDMSWHKHYATELTNLSEEILKKTK